MRVRLNMMLLRNAFRRTTRAPFGKAFGLLLTLFATLFPGVALASGGENVALEFTSSDLIYLWVSLGFGLVALLAGVFLIKSVLAQSPGSAKMQEVGQAIKEGALAYLRRQVRTMIPFVLVLAVGLWAMYNPQYGSTTALFVALSFVGGVAASYIAGYVGMIMAVNGNMRTAHASLTSFKRALEVAFRSGGVAGMITVGMGLIGATIIFLGARGEAMKLLVGFGFGGSLAALFMRVGGGIFTKAADVGADLVGKVEAGIPEDDPRNPATIADNVGDNVGDCAGMAADIFESYEVTLVAAIVLGAATASIFDTATWMKLILFALMARGVGIVASILGILSVRGTDDVNVDALKPIRKGFAFSAIVALIGTAGIAWFMMGGKGDPIKTTQLKSTDEYRAEEIKQVQSVRDQIAKDKKLKDWEVALKDVSDDSRVKTLFPDEQIRQQVVSTALFTELDKLPIPETLKGYQPLDFTKTGGVLDYAINNPNAEQFNPADKVSIKDAFGGTGKDLFVFRLEISPKPAAGQTPPAGQKPETRWYGPVSVAAKDKLIKQATGIEVKELAKVPVALYANHDGDLVAVAEPDLKEPHRVIPMMPLSYYPMSPADYKKAEEASQKDPAKPLPRPAEIKLAVATHNVVPWYLFFIAIAFGVLMAFAIESLTDYYVSTHKKPVQEVAAVATAGPAPMIIQGFAYGLESSVISVFAIVIALLVPLAIFAPALYGGYLLSFYGVALVGLGLLTTTGYILAMDTFGPISDNAQGVYEMSGEGHDNEYGMKGVQRLDAAGNTTKALTKGFAIATAVVAAVALFHSYVEAARLVTVGMPIEVPEIFLGLLIGGAAPYLFSAFSINAVGRAAFELIYEVRSQFRNDPGIMAGTSKPNYGRCVAIVTAAAQKELLGPGVLAIALPALVGFGFAIGKPPTEIGGNLYNLTGAQALGGFLAGAIVSGQLMAVLLANSGGMWDNAKKLIEDGLHGGKGTEAHKAGVVCDTVGDPFKDTAGPALNPLIKVMNLVALLLAPVVILPLAQNTLIIIALVAAAALTFSFWWSKRGSMGSAMTAATAANAAAAIAAPAPGPTVAPKPKKTITVDDEPTDKN
ncbi:MAG: sodium/proton-translocating pyrophosphatase [Fimbriimonadaceae bacterium]|nr:sodium/proton-translocating pyrophosphatase [Fimbriimonadaceae bacterium]